jgi:hypothetical protein
MNSKVKILAVALVAVLLTVTAAVSAQYVINSNNHITGNPGALPSLVLSANNTNVSVGDTLQIIAAVGTSNIAQSGWVITLTNNAVAVGTPQTTDANGHATFYVTVNAAYDFAASGTHT